MNVTGKSISIEQAADCLESGCLMKQMNAGEMNAKWVRCSETCACVLVQGVGDQVLQLKQDA